MYSKEIVITNDCIDINNHVNNVIYHSWIENLASEHFYSEKGNEIVDSINAIWVVKNIHIEYMHEAVLGDELIATTRVESYSKIMSRRLYDFTNKKTGQMLVTAYSDWVLIDKDTRKLKRMTKEVWDYLEKSK